jgi:pilus assembly protein Flp/PilA
MVHGRRALEVTGLAIQVMAARTPLGRGFRGPGEVGVKRMGLYVALRARLGSEEGATAVEYALMIALIALVVVVAVTFLGQQTSAVYDNDTLKTALT